MNFVEPIALNRKSGGVERSAVLSIGVRCERNLRPNLWHPACPGVPWDRGVPVPRRAVKRRQVRTILTWAGIASAAVSRLQWSGLTTNQHVSLQSAHSS
jgi:hypothetical protein